MLCSNITAEELC